VCSYLQLTSNDLREKYAKDKLRFLARNLQSVALEWHVRRIWPNGVDFEEGALFLL
jgi:hypothetical protein